MYLMRLDVYLIETGFFSSRGRAKKAISEGHVKVDGKVTTKSSREVSEFNEIEVDEGLDKPRGYFKLRSIQEKFDLIKEGDSVLDLGSSAGGFLMFACELGANAVGIEYSRHFRSELGRLAYENPNITIILDDVFTMPTSKIPGSPFDVLLTDMTLEPEASIEALGKVLPLLKEGGMIFQVIKLGRGRNKKHLVENIKSLGIEVLEVLDSAQREFYVVAKKT